MKNYLLFQILAIMKKKVLKMENSLICQIPEPKGENCSSGGFKIISGLDLNNNNNLDTNEVQNTSFICNGENGTYDKELKILYF